MKKSLIWPLFCFCCLNVCSQGKDLAFGKQYTISSSILNEDRIVAVFTPPDYDLTNEKYQVIYVLDAEWNFHFVSSLVDKLSGSGDIPKMIVVGIYNTNRTKDLTPSGTNDNPRFGGAEPFLQFMKEELRPWVNETFRTYPYHLLAGHSFGGLFTVYSMMESPGLFHSYIALSPSLGRNDEQQIRHARAFFKEKNSFPDRLYMAVGNEGGATYHSTKKLVDLLEQDDVKFSYHFDHLKEESHSSITTQGFAEGLKFIYQDFNPDRISGLDELFLVEAHFEALSDRFGYELKVPETFYHKFIKEQIGERELEYALYLLKRFGEDYPQSPYLLAYYGDVYLLQGNFEEARNYYEQIGELGLEQDHHKQLLDQLSH